VARSGGASDGRAPLAGPCISREGVRSTRSTSQAFALTLAPVSYIRQSILLAFKKFVPDLNVLEHSPTGNTTQAPLCTPGRRPGRRRRRVWCCDQYACQKRMSCPIEKCPWAQI
jgi:hypothetical protein